MAVLAACTMLWYIPVIIVTTIVHVFVDRWRRLGIKSYIPLYLTGFAVFFCILLLMPLLLRLKITLPSYLIPVGIIILALGLVFLFCSYKALSFKALSWFTELSGGDGRASNHVYRGPYKFCRHPVYSAAFAIMVGVFLASGVVSLAIPSVLLVVLTICEDRELRKRFGAAYVEYSSDTPILLWPKPRKLTKEYLNNLQGQLKWMKGQWLPLHGRQPLGFFNLICAHVFAPAGRCAYCLAGALSWANGSIPTPGSNQFDVTVR